MANKGNAAGNSTECYSMSSDDQDHLDNQRPLHPGKNGYDISPLDILVLV